MITLGLIAAAAVFTAQTAEVVVAPKAAPVVRYAADEATNFLSRVLGAPVPVVEKPMDGRTSLVLGMNEWAAAAGLSTNGLVRDAFIVKSAGSRVYVLGRDGRTDPRRVLAHGGKMAMYFEQGTLMGTYDFLEREAGVRFYFPGALGEAVPRRASFAVPAGERRVKPDFTARYLLAWQGDWFEPVKSPAEERTNWTLNYLRLRFETTSVPCCHGSIRFGYLPRFAKTHPEYFALLPSGERSTDPNVEHTGQLCWTSGVIEEMYADMTSYLRGEKPGVRGVLDLGGVCRWGGQVAQGRYIDLMPQDGFSGCLCPRCQATYTKRYGGQYATDLIWGTVSNLATRLTRDGYDGVISMMAYSPYRAVPDFRLPPNVEVMVAEAGPWSVVNEPSWKAQRDEIRAWADKLGHPVWIWTYPHKFGATGEKLRGVPHLAPRAFAKYYQSVAPWIRGAFAENETDRWFFNYLNTYVFAKLCWDNDIDVEALLAEHHRLMFGKGAAAMAALYDALEEKWLRGALGTIRDTAVGPVMVPPTDEELWAKIYPEPFLDWLDGQCDRAKAAVAPDSLEARRIELVRREFVTSIRTSGKAYLTMAREVKALRHSLTKDAERPIELVPFQGKAGRRSLRTTVWARKSGEDIEVVFDCEEPQMASRVAAAHDEECTELWREDIVELTINPSGDLTKYWHIVVSSAGCRSDAFIPGQIRPDRHPDVYRANLDFTSKVDRRADGWKATVRIPLKSLEGLRYPFPMEFARERHVNVKDDCNQFYHWSRHARGFHELTNFGRIEE